MKKCNKCGESDRRAFSPAQNYVCKLCINATSNAWKSANPEKNKARKKKYRQDNPEKVAACNKKWRDENPEKEAARNKKWGQENPDKNAAKGARYRAAKLQRTPPWCNQEELKPFYTESAAQGMHVDHIVPMQGELVSGLNIPGNLQLLTP